MNKENEEKYEKRRIRGAHVTTVISLCIVLFLLNLQGILWGYSHKILNLAKENIQFVLEIKDYTRESDILDLQKIIDRSPYVKSTRYISKAEAAKELQEDIGQDFVEFLGYNPLHPSIVIHFNAAYVNQDSIDKFEEEFTMYHNTMRMEYPKDLVEMVNKNVRKAMTWMGILSLLVLVLAVFLISNTMKLLIYSKRFSINTMQLVGATPSFIRKPFLKKSFLQGLLSGGIAILLTAVLLLYLHGKAPAVFNMKDGGMIVLVFAVVLVTGIAFTMISARISVDKYLKMRNSDRLYD